MGGGGKTASQRRRGGKILLAFLGEVFALVGAVEKFSIEQLNADDRENELKGKKS